MANFIEATCRDRNKKTWINLDLVTEFFENDEGGTRFIFQIPDNAGDIIYSDVKESIDITMRQISE